MKFNLSVNNFTSGEWSPKMRARTDVQQYRNAAETMENFIPQLQGGAFRRPGTENIVLDTAQNTDLQTAYDAGNKFDIKSKIITAVLSNSKKMVTIALDGVPSTTWISHDSGANTETDLDVVASDADIAKSAKNIIYTQVGDVVVMVDSAGTIAPRVLTYSDAPNGGLFTVFTYIANSGWTATPYLPANALGSSVNLTTSGTSGTITITASGGFFASTHVGAWFKFSSGGNTGVARITGFTSSTVVTASVFVVLPLAGTYGTAAGTSWEESSWSDFRGWPRTVTAYEGRLFYGGSKLFPDTVWASAVDNYFYMMERPFEQDPLFADFTTDNTTAFSFTPNNSESSNIRSMTSGKNLFIVTDKSEMNVNSQQGIGKLDIKIESASAIGGDAIQPVRVNNFVTYMQKGGRKVRDIVFDFNTDQYKSNDLSFLADHLTVDFDFDSTDADDSFVDPIVETVAMTNENSGILCKTRNGRLLFLALDRDYQVNAWCRLTFGGTSEVRDYAMIKSVGVIEGAEGEGDRVYMIVVREIDSNPVVTFERMSLQNENTAQNLATFFPNFVDCRTVGTSVNPTIGDVWSGFSLYEGETLQVMLEGVYVGDLVVDGTGQITIPAPTLAGFTTAPTRMYAGFGYTSTLKPLPPELGNQVPDSAQGFTKRVDEIIIKFYLTRGAKYGYKLGSLIDIDFKNPNEAMNATPTFYTGIQRLKFATDYSREPQVIIQQNKPYPCNVLAVVCKGVTYD